MRRLPPPARALRQGAGDRGAGGEPRPTVAAQRSEEAERLLAKLPAGSRLVALAREGTGWSSEELARRLGRWMQGPAGRARDRRLARPRLPPSSPPRPTAGASGRSRCRTSWPAWWWREQLYRAVHDPAGRAVSQGRRVSARMTEWFEEWFGEEYLQLYPHRDDGRGRAGGRPHPRADGLRARLAGARRGLRGGPPRPRLPGRRGPRASGSTCPRRCSASRAR